jgi:hypothetical protein
LCFKELVNISTTEHEPGDKSVARKSLIILDRGREVKVNVAWPVSTTRWMVSLSQPDRKRARERNGKDRKRRKPETR